MQGRQPGVEAGGAQLSCCGVVLAPIAILLAMGARHDIAKDPKLTGDGEAKAAIVIAILALVLWVIGVYLRFSGAFED